MQNSAKPVPSQPPAELEDTIRTEMADDSVQPAGSGAPTPQSQFALLQTAIGKFTDDQLLAALSQVPDFRLACVLARRLNPSAAAIDQPKQEVAAQTDQRSGDRAKVLRSGKIIYNNKMSVSDCKIRDISQTGCRIAMESTAGIPKNFTLQILNGDTMHECEVAWRSSMAMGVRFID